MSELEDLLKGLDDQLDPEKIREREDAFKRPMDRSPLIDFTATIAPFDDNPVVEVKVFDRTEKHLKINLKDIEATRVSKSYTGDEDHITVRMATPRRNGDIVYKDTDEFALMVTALKAQLPDASVLKLPGLRITFEERSLRYTYDKEVGGEWIPTEAKTPRFYYAATKIEIPQGSKASGPSEVGVETAMGLLIEAGAEGMKETDFHKQVSKLPIPTADKAYVGGGKFATDMIAAKRVVRRGDALVAV